jgi:cytochrome c5
MKYTLIGLALLISFAAIAVAEENKKGADIYNSNCQLCHQLPEPEMLRPSQWDLVLKTMQKRMEENDIEPLSGEEMEAVIKYLEESSKK